MMWCAYQASRLMAVAAIAALLAGPASAQEKPAGKTDAKPSAAEKETAKKAKKPSVRMPMYYGDVVDKAQREKIAAILGQYTPKINDLKAQLEALTKERDEKLAAVLTPEQAKKIEQLKAAAKAKRQAGKETKPSAPAKEPAVVEKHESTVY